MENKIPGLIKRFGESIGEPTVQWYESTNGEKINCTEIEIDTLWWEWVDKVNSKRADDDRYTIFEFGTPIKFPYS